MTDIQVTGVTDARYWSAAARLEVSKKVAMALAETKDEHKLARSMVQPFEDNVSHAARKTIFPYFLRQLSNAASDRINRLSKFMVCAALRELTSPTPISIHRKHTFKSSYYLDLRCAFNTAPHTSRLLFFSNHVLFVPQADNGFEAEEQGLQNLRRRLEGALMQLRMKK